MNWIQIGDKAINLERIILVEFDPDDGTVALYPDVSDVTNLVLWDKEAEEFKVWWKANIPVTRAV